MKVISWIKKQYEKLRLKNVALVAVMITQSLKRFANSEFGLFIIEMLPAPWFGSISKLLGISRNINKILGQVVRGIVISKGILDQDNATDEKLALSVLADHLKHYNKDELNGFLKYMAIEIIKAHQNDNILSDEEIEEIMEKGYQYLFKN